MIIGSIDLLLAPEGDYDYCFFIVFGKDYDIDLILAPEGDNQDDDCFVMT